MICMFIFFSSFILRSRRSDVVPWFVTTVLPARSGKSRMPDVVRVSRRVVATKKVVENATCAWRAARLVVTPHSRSTVPFCTSGMRFCDVTGMKRTCRSGLPVRAFTAAITRSHRSCEKPMTLPPAST